MASGTELLPRVAIVSEHAEELTAQLAATAHPAALQAFRDLYSDGEAIARFQPSVLFVDHPAGAEEAGALRMLRALMPTAATVLVCDADDEVRARATAERIDARVVLHPFNRQQLTGLFGAVLERQTGTSAEALLDLARGISDEINNPLMFLGGHVQLLARTLADHPAGQGQLPPIQDGIARITATMAKVRLLARTADIAKRAEPVDLRALAAGLAGDGERALRLEAPAPVPATAGDPELLRAMLDDLARVATALPVNGSPPIIRILDHDGGPRVQTVLGTANVPSWRLPRTFEPYYLSRILRGTPLGLSLFLVQAVAHGHGGRAVARWERPTELGIEIDLPGVR